MSLQDEHDRAQSWSIGLGVLLILVGVAAIVFPLAATLASTIFFAWILVAGGVVGIVHAIRSRHRRGFTFALVAGLIYLATGILLLVFPVQGVLALTLVLGVFLLLEGILEIALAFELRPLKGWAWVLADGIVIALLGLLIWLRWPSTAAWTIGLLVGVSIIASGVSRIVISLYSRRAYAHGERSPLASAT